MTSTPLRFGYLPLADSVAVLLCCGEMTRQGVSFEPVKFANNHLLLEALKKGEIDGGISSAVFLPELAKDKQIRILGAASREGVTFFAAPGGKYQELSNLKGARVSLPAKLTVHGALLYKTAERQGLKWGEDLTVKYLPPMEGFKALSLGEVDLVAALEPLAARIESEGKFTTAGRSRELWLGHLSFISVILEEKIKQAAKLEEKWGECRQRVQTLIGENYQGVAQVTAPLLGCEAIYLEKILNPHRPKILYTDRVITDEEKREWNRLAIQLKT